MGNCSGTSTKNRPTSNKNIIKVDTKRTGPLQPEYEYVFKLLLVGDSGVGKSSLLLRFADNMFTESFITTIGVDFKIRTVDVGGKIVKLQVWDTAGQERYRTITGSLYRGAHGIFMVYDTTYSDSFMNVAKWLTEIDRYAHENVSKVLLGNKIDMESERKVTTEAGRELAEQLGMKFYEASARESTNVDKAFQHITEEILSKLEEDV